MARRTARSPEWFRTLFDEHYWTVRAYALRRAAQAMDADDVVSEVFLVAWRRRAQVPPDPAEARSWLLAVARGVLGNQRRSQWRRHRLGTRASAMGGRREVDDAVAKAVEADAVQRLLGRLRPVEREVLLLVEWDGLARSDAAAVLSISENAVNIRLFKARNALRELIGREAEREKRETAEGTP